MNSKYSTAMLLLLLAALAIPSARSATSPTVYVDPQNSYAFVGRSFSLNMAIANVTNLNSWEVMLSFNPSALTALSASLPANNIFAGYNPSSGSTIDNTAGTIDIFAFLPTSTIGVNGSGTLCQVVFQPKTIGTSNLSIIKGTVPGTTRLYDRTDKYIDFGYVNGAVQVASSEVKLSVPFDYQSKTYYSGPAALEMVFDKYGPDIPQLEIAQVAGTHPNITFTDWLRRAGHFSNMSTSMGTEMPQNITGYSLRKFGYGAFEKQGLTINQLQGLVSSGYPVIVSTWYDLSKQQSSHYRVVVGFNATHLYLHDPWNKSTWSGQYGGPYTAIDYSTFSTLWDQSSIGTYNWGLLVIPWEVSVTFVMLHLQPYSVNVTATIQYVNSPAFTGTSYTASLASATISLPTNLTLNAGDTATKSLGSGNLAPGGSATVSWIVNSNSAGKYVLRIQTGGKISGSVGAHGIYQAYNYQDIIGGNSSTTVWLGGTLSSPYPGDITGDGKVDVKDLARAAHAFGSYTGSPKYDPVADITGPTKGVPDGKVDIRDIATIAKYYGKTY